MRSRAPQGRRPVDTAQATPRNTVSGSRHHRDGRSVDLDISVVKGPAGWSYGVGFDYVNDGFSLGFDYARYPDYDDYHHGYGYGYYGGIGYYDSYPSYGYGCGYGAGYGYYGGYRRCYAPYRYGYSGCGWYDPWDWCWGSGVGLTIGLGLGYGGGYGYGYGSSYYDYSTTVYAADTSTYQDAVAAYDATSTYETGGFSGYVENEVVEVPIEAYPSAAVQPTDQTAETTSWTLLDLASASSAAYVESGLQAFAASDYSRARRDFAAGILSDPADSASRLGYGLSYFAEGRARAAARSLRRAVMLDANLLRGGIDVRSMYPDPGLYERHLQALADHLATNAGDADGWLVLSYLQWSDGAAAAQSSAERVLDLTPDDVVAELLRDTIETNRRGGGMLSPYIIESRFLD